MASGRPSKRTLVEFLDDNTDFTQKIYRFQILLPNGTSVRLILQDPGEEMFVDEFVHAIRKETEKMPSAQRSKRKVLWDQDIYLEDMFDFKIRKKISFCRFVPNKLHILRLQDGAGDCINNFHNMWDLTPHTDLLHELPAEYTFETALADLIDNALQAVWSNGPNERRLIRVTASERTIIIFDSGQGMDGCDENSITKWGKMGSSNHRSSRKKAVGDSGSYLMPFFGMFGYGGPIASMHLGKNCTVTSKTKTSKKVYILHLSREALLSQSTPKCIWRTDGGFREPSEMEMQVSPHGSFTQVKIRDLKLRCLDSYKLQCLIKDFYFPYIQFDEDKDSGKTTMPIEFEVNGTNLAEIHGGEVAVTNSHSCNGPDFIFQVKFLLKQHISSSQKSFDSTSIREANARLKCIYFPIVEGKENIERILEKLEKDGWGIKENFDNFARVSVRRLGRLLPDSRWNLLPFLDAKQKRGDKAQLLKRCCRRVKCFIETDAGFSPTPSKTDLAHHDPFTLALKNFNFKPSEKESEMSVDILKDTSKLSFGQLEKEFKEWIIKMHDRYDEEIVCGEDEPVLVVGLSDKKILGVTSEVVRVHHVIKRKGTLWKSGQKVKILKGAPGCYNNNIYATLEYILIEGFQGDAGGEARLICRPIDCCEKGCKLTVDHGNASLEIQGSISFPISLIDSEKIQVVNVETWSYQLKKLEDKRPSKIEILTGKLGAQLGIHEDLPMKTYVIAGSLPPKEIVAIIRPASFSPSSAHNGLDQKFIVKADLEMTLEIRCSTRGKKSPGILLHSESVKSSSRNGFHGLYVFSLLQSSSKLFQNAGTYTFYFSTVLKGTNIQRLEVQEKVVVKPDLNDCQWRFVPDQINLVTRVGSKIPCLSIGCFDMHSNQIPFPSEPQAIIKLHSDERLPACVLKSKMTLSSDQLLMKIHDIFIKNRNLDMVRPNYEFLLNICSKDGQFSAAIPCKVLPGPASGVKMRGSSNFEDCLAPGDVIQELILEILDAYGNHIVEGEEISIQLDGFCFADSAGSIRKVNSEGQVNLTRALKVVSGFGSHVYLSVFFAQEKIFEKVCQVVMRELRVVSEVHENCVAGTRLENVVFEVTSPDGVIDENIHGSCHTITIQSEMIRIDDTQYTFKNGRCTVPVVPIPNEPGPFCFVAFHTHFPELKTSIMVHVISSPKLEMVDVTSTSLHSGHSFSPFPDDEMLFLRNSSQDHPALVSPLFVHMNNDAQKLEEKLTQIGLDIKESENKIKMLENRKREIEDETLCLEASTDPQYDKKLKLIANTRENIQKQVEGKDTAAAVFCHLSKAMRIQASQLYDGHFMSDVVGVVALLGTVSDMRLSRILAEFLGGSNMLAIVCKSFKSAIRLEKYHEDGETDYQSALHEEANRLGISIRKRFTVLCLDEIKKFPGQIKDDPQRSLSLPDPNLNGRVPNGFLGHAVNMLNLDTDHLNIRTSVGYGLRETLFYKLFGNVQVYRTWNEMLEAHPVIKDDGAVSLDGGIMRDSETILFGRNCDPDIIFPVSGPTVPENVVKLMRLKESKKALDHDIEREVKLHAALKAKFDKKYAKINQLLSKMDNL